MRWLRSRPLLALVLLVLWLAVTTLTGRVPANARTTAAAPRAAPRTNPTAAVAAGSSGPPSAGERINPLHLEIQ